ncbi:penicillin acylase family protein [Limibacter armeniacum]|uniref:penicillin acylase family protein n=1 Tax=Limibacter armeniacum TaxID=466084 RepID=UPI002FE5C1FD
MKKVKALLAGILTISLVVAMNTRMGTVPPVGKFLDPFNGFWQNAKTKQVDLPTTTQFPQLQGKATLLYDSLLIPHIYAESDHDLYFLQGYVTAANRLWQMEFQTHAAAGRISEIVGKDAIEFDRAQRRKGLGFGAKNFMKQLEKDPQSSLVVNAYTEGINAYIASLSDKDLPIEYKLLNYKPEPWTALKCAYMLKYMADDLSGWNADFEYSNALALFGKEYFSTLYPDMLAKQDPVVNGTTEWDFEPLKAERPDNVAPIVDIKESLAAKPNPDNGSNNWAVNGTKTQSGNPMLCNDPHLGLNLPSIWYAIHLTSPTVNTMGVSLPGTPCIIIGFNENVSWGVTNARRDVQDWYKITYKDDSKSEYLLDENWVKTDKVIEEIKVRDGSTYLDTVCYTSWGPVMYDETFGDKKERNHYALRWTAHDPSVEVTTFYKLNRAKNYDDYRKALLHYTCPAQNFVFAANDGDIAMTIQGKFPLKWEEQGKFVMDGSTSSMAWQGFIPMEHNVYTKNPERGFVSSANQHPVDASYPYYNFDASYQYYRNRRINERLGSMSDITKDDMETLLDDNFNMMASESLPFFLASLDSTALNEHEVAIADKLAKWNCFNDATLIEPVYYEAWINKLYPMIWDEMTSNEALLLKPNKTVSIELLKNNPNLSFMDIQDTEKKETAIDLINLSFKEAIKEVQTWQENKDSNQDWAEYKGTYLRHLARLAPFNVTGIRNGGNSNIVNATSKRHGPSWRMVVEMDPKGTKAWGAYPGGQSGNPGNPYYQQMVNRWEACELYPLPFFSAKAIQEAKPDGESILAVQTFGN